MVFWEENLLPEGWAECAARRGPGGNHIRNQYVHANAIRSGLPYEKSLNQNEAG